MTNDTIDLDLVDKTVALIPPNAWEHARKIIVTTLVDNMPGSVVERLTGSYDAFDQAEKCLFNYYQLPDKCYELIIDAFKIMGAINALELLNSAQLDQFINDGIPFSDSTQVPAMQGGQTQDN
jgi:hypothetical protein